MTDTERADPSAVALPRYWVSKADSVLRLRGELMSGTEWMTAYRWITNTTNERTFVTSATPLAAFGNSAPVSRFRGSAARDQSHWSAVGASLAFDYCVRQKLGGVNMTFGTTHQLPFATPSLVSGLCTLLALPSWVAGRTVELAATADDMASFSEDLWAEGDGAVFRYDPERRFEIRCELDAAFFHLYLGSDEEWSRTGSPELLKALPTPRDAVSYIMDTFPIVKRKDEEAHGHYRTKDRILELYDELQRCLASGEPFKSALNPPPGPPTNTDGSFAALPPWPKDSPQPKNWPSHIHPPVSHRT
jgi:hypothetical protein